MGPEVRLLVVNGVYIRRRRILNMIRSEDDYESVRTCRSPQILNNKHRLYLLPTVQFV